MSMKKRVERVFSELYPINRSLTGKGVHETFDYLLNNFPLHGEIKSVPSGTKVFDWIVPDEWNVDDGYILNGAGEKIVDFNIALIRYMRERGHSRVEARPEEAAKWLAQVIKVNEGRLAGKIPSWQTGVNANVPGRQSIRVLGYYGGAVRYREIADQVAAGGYKELIFR